ncbi:MAG: metallophosphoesterase [Deltaproteobacteria bacterium]|nr:metallophosphoesterase [Deltaproteobacteria bacterium]
MSPVVVDETLALSFRLLAALTLVGVPAYAWRVRGRTYAIFALVILALSLPGAVLAHERLRTWLSPAATTVADGAFAFCMAAAGLHLVALVRPRLRTRAFRWLVSVPGMAFVAAGTLSGLWLLALLPVRAALALLGYESALDGLRWLDLVPFVIAVVSILTSYRLADEIVRVRLGKAGPETVSRLPVERYRRRPPEPLTRRPLRIVQITDPHLGPWQPVHRLQRRIGDLIDREPDLVLLTGDFLTMEGMGSPGALREALAPLRAVSERCFAIFGNHDHESAEEVRAALAANGIRLLVDEEIVTETAVGPVQIVGADYVGRGRGDHIRALLARFPRRRDVLRLFLLHDPSGFRHVPVGDVDLTLSGHTHGGQLGLVSFGLDWTVLSRTRWPDHGLFGHGANRLYVHRGTGFYGFPLRIGVPGELSILELVQE